MEIRLVAFDLDGTLLDDNKCLSERNRRALEACADRGICLVPCTGRIKNGIPPEVMAIRGIHYAVVINGAGIVDIREEKMLDRKLMPPETALAVMAVADAYPGIMYDAYIDGGGISEEKFYDHLEKFAIPPGIQKMIRQTRVKVPSIMGYIRETNRAVDKINMYFADLEDKEMMRRLLRQFPDTLVSSSVYNNLEINGEGAEKGDALLRLAAYLGIDRSQIMAFGDGENDYSMIEKAGVGVAMGNGDARLKELADYVTAGNNESGVAGALEELVLSGD